MKPIRFDIGKCLFICWHLLPALPAIALASCQHRYEHNFFYSPQQTLLEIISDLERHGNLDPYRFPPPKDLSGQNVWQAGLVRLANYEALYPGKHRDIVLFAQGNACQRLRDYSTAYERFAAVAAGAGDLAGNAARRMKFLKKMIDIQRRRPPQSALLQEWIEFQKIQAERWRDLSESNDAPDPLYSGLCLIEYENAEREWSNLIWTNRDVIENGVPLALKAMNALIEHHADSRLADQHRLTLGLCHFELARQYTQRHPPEGLDFDQADFNRITALSRREFLAVERRFGSPYRPEAAAHRAALEAFIERIRTQSR